MEVCLAAQRLPWPIQIKRYTPFFQLSVRVRDHNGVVSRLKVVDREDDDKVTLPRFSKALNRLITRINSAEHMGLEVIP